MSRRTQWLAGLVLGLALVGCEGGVGDPLAPVDATAARGGIGKSKTFEPVRIAGDLDLPAVTARGWVGPEGGTVGLWPFQLSVPRGAVREPTRFTVHFPGTEYLEVDLVAEVVREGRLARVKDFRKPLEFSVGYTAGVVMNALGLSIAHLPGDKGYDRMEPLPTNVDEASGKAKAKLKHFSRYCLVEG